MRPKTFSLQHNQQDWNGSDEMSSHTSLDALDSFLAFLVLHIAFWSGPPPCVATVFPPAPLACILGRSTFLGEVQADVKKEREKQKREKHFKDGSSCLQMWHFSNISLYCWAEMTRCVSPFISTCYRRKRISLKKSKLSTGNCQTRKCRRICVYSCVGLFSDMASSLLISCRG